MDYVRWAYPCLTWWSNPGPVGCHLAMKLAAFDRQQRDLFSAMQLGKPKCLYCHGQECLPHHFGSNRPPTRQPVWGQWQVPIFRHDTGISNLIFSIQF